MEEERRRGGLGPPNEGREDGDWALDSTVEAPLPWREHAPAPTARTGPRREIDSIADDAIPVLLSEPRLASEHTPPSSLALETMRTPPVDAPEGALDKTSEWGAPRRTSSVESIGKVVAGRYLLGPVLGVGGMGTVFQAQHTDLGKRVAIKVLAAMFDGEAEATARFLREAKAASTIESEHIAQVFDVGEDLHLGLYMVMELLKGEDLSRVLLARGPLRPEVAAGIGWQVCLALERAHAAGVVHRDLKPANVFLTQGDDGSIKVKVLDFGIAKLLHDARSRTLGITQHGIVVGTPHYMSPEQAQGLETVDHRTDLYSLGVLLFEAIAGSPPFPELQSYEETLYKILCEAPPRLASRAPGVHPAMDDLVAHLMSREPDRRPATAREVRSRLATIFPSLGRRTLVLGDGAPSVQTPALAPPRTGSGVTVDSDAGTTLRRARRPRPALLVAAATLVLATLVVAFLVVRDPSAATGANEAALGPAVQAAGAQVSPGAAPSPPATGVARLLAAEVEIAGLVEQAQRALEHGNPGRARDLAAEAARRAPANAEAWLTLGAALESLGDRPAARAAYQTCKAQAEGDRARECAALLAR